MKKNILTSFALLALLAACNDDYNDQFDINVGYEDVKSLTMTLSASDYATIAGNETNQGLALAKDPEGGTGVTALKAVGENKYFTAEASAEEYIPAFLLAKYPNADLKSKFTVTYNQYQAPSNYLKDFTSISSYTLTSEDYDGVWGDKVKASFLSPTTVGKIPAILKEQVPTPEAGDMVAVDYAYSETEPSIGGGGEVVETINTIAEALASAGDYVVEGTVIATYARGMLISDKTGSILVYLNVMPNYAVGDIVKVDGSTSAYAQVMQFGNTSIVTRTGRVEAFAYPEAKAISGAELDAYVAKVDGFRYVSITGELIVDGNYLNLNVEGASKQGSISYPFEGVVDKSLHKHQVTVKGYLIGASSRYNVMVTSVEPAEATETFSPIGEVALAQPGDYTVKGQVIATYQRGFLLSDGSGKILVFDKNGFTFAVGDIVKVSGAVTAYGGFNQFGTAPVCEKLMEGVSKYPIPLELGTEEMEAYLESPFIAYVSYTGTLSISGTYYNVIIDGTDKCQGSIQYPIEGVVDQSLNGKKVVVEGFTLGVSGGKYVNTMALKVGEASSTKAFNAMTRAAVAANRSELYRFDGTGWEAYTNDDAKIAVVEPAVYASIGASSISEPEMVLPLYLNEKYPYAIEAERAAVVYKKSSDAMEVKEFTKTAGAWIITPEFVQQVTTFNKEAEGITAKISVYMDAPLTGGNDGGFTAQDVILGGGMSYIWTCDNTYGWKGGAYANNKCNAAESWLVSPALDFRKGTAPVMTFEEAVNKLGAGYAVADHTFMMISSDYKDDVTKATWTEVPLTNRPAGVDWNFVKSDEIDLSGYVGEMVRIAFKYTSNEESAPTWEIKNILIKEKNAE